MRATSSRTSRFTQIPDAEVWLVGGYGDVGIKLARLLIETTAHRVVLAGRDQGKADSAATVLGPRARGVGIDATAGLPGEAMIVVNFVEAVPPASAADVVARGGLFIDASAEPGYLERLRAAIPGGPGLAILNAGLTPGLTNVLARDLKAAHPETRRIDAVLEMGMGRHHGQAAVQGTLEALGSSFRAKRAGRWRDVTTGAERRKVRFSVNGKRVPAIGFPFSDQIAIARALDLDEARTFLALAPALTTRMLGMIAGLAVGRWVARNAGAIARLMSALPPQGPVRTRLLVEAFDGRGNRLGAHTMRSGDQADVTAAMLARAVSDGVASTAGGVADFDEIVGLPACRSALKEMLPETEWYG